MLNLDRHKGIVMTVQTMDRDLGMWTDRPDSVAPLRLQGEVTVDYLIVGGGFTGLSTAYHLKRLQPSASVVILEAHQVGSGASGRNTGILRPGLDAA